VVDFGTKKRENLKNQGENLKIRVDELKKGHQKFWRKKRNFFGKNWVS